MCITCILSLYYCRQVFVTRLAIRTSTANRREISYLQSLDTACQSPGDDGLHYVQPTDENTTDTNLKVFISSKRFLFHLPLFLGPYLNILGKELFVLDVPDPAAAQSQPHALPTFVHRYPGAENSAGSPSGISESPYSPCRTIHRPSLSNLRFVLA